MTIRTLPIRLKLIAVTTMTALVALILASAALFFFETRSFRANLERELSTLAQVIGANASAAASFFDEDAAAEFLTALRAEPQITAAAIYSANNTRLAEYVRDPDGKFAPPPRPGADGFVATPEVLTLFAPIVDHREGVRVGTILFQADYRSVSERVKTYGTALFGVFGMAALVAASGRSELSCSESDP